MTEAWIHTFHCEICNRQEKSRMPGARRDKWICPECLINTILPSEEKMLKMVKDLSNSKEYRDESAEVAEMHKRGEYLDDI